MKLVIQANLDLRNSSFPFSNLELFDLRNIYVLNLKTSLQKNALCLQVELFLKSRVHCTEIFDAIFRDACYILYFANKL